jgi:hypothetical protein
MWKLGKGASLIAAGTVDGDYVYGCRMTIVEPIYEGRLYTYKVSVWDANTKVLLGSASASYVEKYCPDVQISDVSWDGFVYGRSATARVAVRNLGERGWTFTVEAWTEGARRGGGLPLCRFLLEPARLLLSACLLPASSRPATRWW